MINYFDLVDARSFIVRITVGRLTTKQVSRTLAYLWKKKIVFYDDFQKFHVLNSMLLMEHKLIIIESLQMHYT